MPCHIKASKYNSIMSARVYNIKRGVEFSLYIMNSWCQWCIKNAHKHKFIQAMKPVEYLTQNESPCALI